MHMQTTADEIWRRATDLLTSLQHALTGPTPDPNCLSPKGDGTAQTLTLEQEVQELTRGPRPLMDT